VFVSVSLVFVNKFVLSYSPEVFPFPLFVTWFQLVVQLICTVFLGFFGQCFPAYALVPPFEFKIPLAKQVLPLTLVYVAMLATNNLSLQNVEVSYFQIARSLAVVFQLILSYLFLASVPTGGTIRACLVVIAGFVIGTGGEVRFSWTGVIYGVISSGFIAGHGILVKKILPKVDNNEWLLLIYNTVMSLVLMFPLVVIYDEWRGVLSFVPQNPVFHWTVLSVTGFLGFMINIAVFLQIKFTSPLTSVVVGASKSCIQTILSVLIFRNPVSFWNGFGLLLTIIGTFLYSYVRYLKMKEDEDKRKGDKS